MNVQTALNKEIYTSNHASGYFPFLVESWYPSCSYFWKATWCKGVTNAFCLRHWQSALRRVNKFTCTQIRVHGRDRQCCLKVEQGRENNIPPFFSLPKSPCNSFDHAYRLIFCPANIINWEIKRGFFRFWQAKEFSGRLLANIQGSQYATDSYLRCP